MTCGIHDSAVRIVNGQLPTIRPTSVVPGAAVGNEVGRHVDKHSSLGFVTDALEVPEVIADVDHSVVPSNLLGDLSATDLYHDWKIHAQTKASISITQSLWLQT